MSKLRVHGFSISLDGYGAGTDQDFDNPIGRGGLALHEWMTNTRTFQQMFGHGQGTTGVDDDFVARGFENVGAWILGRNMFGPIRGDWPDDTLERLVGKHIRLITPTCSSSPTMRARRSTWTAARRFYFVTEGIQVALERATSAAKGKDVRLGGGVSAIRQYLQARLIDEMHVAISPVMLGNGEHLLGGIDTLALGYDCTQHVTISPNATHFG